MKREEIKSIFPEATDEQLDKILGINGADIEKSKGKVTALEADIAKKKEAYDGLTAELKELKEKNASAEDWQAKYDAIVKENEKKAAEAEEAKKAEAVKSRFETVMGEKKFVHDAIKADYERKFGEALKNKEYEGKSDADIFAALTKDDAKAFVGVEAIRLDGGNPNSGNPNDDEARTRAIMGLPPINK